MFLSIDQIKDSLQHLKDVHPFYGITFLVCKKAELPVGGFKELSLDAEDKAFLDRYYKPDKDSEWYLRIFRTSDKSKDWLRPDYASSGLQAINTQTFRDALRHKKQTELWGWTENYVSALKSHLYRAKLIPAFHLAVWLYRDREWFIGTTGKDVVNTFFGEFSIRGEEKRELFDASISDNVDQNSLFQEEVVTWNDLRGIADPPPDAKPEEGGTLALLQIQGVGPAKKLEFRPAERLNLITGDNGLGKTFILECAWWALTGEWADREAYPRQDIESNEPEITFQILGERRFDPVTIPYDWSSNRWASRERYPTIPGLTIPGLIVYARVDGSFAVYDPAMNNLLPVLPTSGVEAKHTLIFTRDEVWDGLVGKIEGLIRDWVSWQNKPEKHPFDIFVKVLRRLSPPDLGVLEPGEPTRIPRESRWVPTLKHPYGEVPIVYASAGVRRIITLAYLIVWAWNEHKINSSHARKDPQSRMVILVDEMEAHLHPQWQRAVLPALLDVTEELAEYLQAQFMVATHSPLVMASVEPMFDEERDKLFHLDLESNGNVIFKDLQFVLYGAVDSWLTSEVFELRHARSREAEAAILKAIALQKQDDPKAEDVKRVSEELMQHLSAEDKFWSRWLFFAEQHGVEL